MAKLFSFVLDSFQIATTRSWGSDTDYVSFTVVVTPKGGEGTPLTVSKAMGDVNDGDHPVNLSFPNIQVNPGDTVLLNYVILNFGHGNPGTALSLVENAGIKIAKILGPDFGQALGSLLGLNFFETLAEQFVILLNADCDGPVAAEQVSFTFEDLVAGTAHGPLTRTTDHPGTDSPSGCGSNSFYSVKWHILDSTIPAPVPDKKVPNVIEDSVKNANAAVIAAGLVPVFTGAAQTKHSRVISQAPNPGVMVFAGSTVRMRITNLTAP